MCDTGEEEDTCESDSNQSNNDDSELRFNNREHKIMKAVLEAKWKMIAAGEDRDSDTQDSNQSYDSNAPLRFNKRATKIINRCLEAKWKAIAELNKQENGTVKRKRGRPRKSDKLTENLSNNLEDGEVFNHDKSNKSGKTGKKSKSPRRPSNQGSLDRFFQVKTIVCTPKPMSQNLANKKDDLCIKLNDNVDEVEEFKSNESAIQPDTKGKKKKERKQRKNGKKTKKTVDENIKTANDEDFKSKDSANDEVKLNDSDSSNLFTSPLSEKRKDVQLEPSQKNKLDEIIEKPAPLRISTNLFMSPRRRLKNKVDKIATVDEEIIKQEGEDEVKKCDEEIAKVCDEEIAKVCDEEIAKVCDEEIAKVGDGNVAKQVAFAENVTVIKTPPTGKNVFELMMDGRSKVIGKNSPGKELAETEEEQLNDSRKKLSERKAKLEKWNKKKGGLKRKLDDELREVQVKNILESRGAYLKEILAVEEVDKQEPVMVKKRRKILVLESSDEEACIVKSPQPPQVDVIIEDTADDELFKEKYNKDDAAKRESKKVRRLFPKPKMPHIDKDIIIVLNSSDDVVLDKDESNSDNATQLRRSTRSRTVKNYNEVEVVEEAKVKRATGPVSKKIAPVFAKSAPKPKIDPKVLEARRNFLHSDIPQNLKRIIKRQESLKHIEYDPFPKISHVQQKDDSMFWNLQSCCDLKLADDVQYTPEFDYMCMGTITKCNSNDLEQEIVLKPPRKLATNYKVVLEAIRYAHPDYPVDKTFNLLCERNGVATNGEDAKPTDCADSEDVGSVMWVDKYKPRSSQDVIGNRKCVNRLREWLQNWLELSKEINAKRKRRDDDDSWDFESTDGDSRDSTRLPGNAMILRGPSGSGKTSTVYAVCEELNINVLELNASSRRTGKRLYEKLSEATKSHQLRKDDKVTNALTKFIAQKPGQQQQQKQSKHKYDNKKATKESMEHQTNRMCLVLVEDVDIVFEQDDGFISALNQLLITSKRPIVLIATNTNVVHLQKLIANHPLLPFAPLYSSPALAIWLEILCLVEGLHVDKSALGQLLEWNKGDVRRTLLQLEFWLKSGGDALQSSNTALNECRVLFKRNQAKQPTSDDDSNDDYVNSADSNELLLSDNDEHIHENCVCPFLIRSDNSNTLSLPSPIDLTHTWRNVPNLLDSNTSLDNYAQLCDAFSLSDVLRRSEDVDEEREPCHNIYQPELKDNLQFRDDSIRADWKSDRWMLNELTHSLVEGYCNLTMSKPAKEMKINNSEVLSFRKKQFACERLFMDSLPLSSSAHIDRNAFATDYFPALCNIARTENQRAATNKKRGNRFYNYLRTLNINPNKTEIETACKIFEI